MNGTTFGILSVLIGLFVFGTAFNWFISRAHARKLTEGYTALLVVFGTLVTIGGIHMLSLFWQAPPALLAIIAFAASGTPMVIGDIARYLQMRERERKELRNL